MKLTDPTNLQWAKDIGLPVGMFIAGFLARSLFLTKKERKDVEQANFQNSRTLIEQHDKAYRLYVDAVEAYATSEDPNLTSFVAIASTGDTFFYQASQICDAILSDKVDRQSRDNTLLPKVRDVAFRLLPDHYDTLASIAAKKHFEYQGELRRSDYPGIFAVVEKFGLVSEP